LIAPGLAGFDALRAVAQDDRVALPVFAHPALLGTFALHPDSGIAHGLLFGVLPRLAGADGTVYPSFGGRFSFSREECREIVDGTAKPLGGLRQSFPIPGGGMNLDRVPELRKLYGPELIILIGGGLFEPGPDLVANCRHFRDLVETGGT
jgi:ribulose-bisphosphate carboxylase large chain